MPMVREAVAVAPRSAAAAEAKLTLLEELPRCRDVAAPAQRAAEWLVAHGGTDRAVFAAPEYARGPLTCVAGAGISRRQYERFSISLDDSAHPLVAALINGSSTSFRDKRDLRV